MKTNERMKALSEAEIQEQLKTLDGWEFEDDRIGKSIDFANFKEAMAFMVRVGFEAEAQGHHPEWYNVYKTVAIQLSTHDADGKVTEKDIKLARAIEEVLGSLN